MVNELYVGDHIYVQRYSPVTYTHHGIVIDVQDKITYEYDRRLKKQIKFRTEVVWVAHPVKFNSYVKYMVTPLEEFIGDLKYCTPTDILDIANFDAIYELKSMVDVNPYHLINIKKYDERLSIPKIVQNALDFVKSDKSYCLLTNNCEMFAEYCSTGTMPIVSKQVVDNVKKYVTGSDIISNINTFIVDGLFSLFE
jgi:hypothetical protein